MAKLFGWLLLLACIFVFLIVCAVGGPLVTIFVLAFLFMAWPVIATIVLLIAGAIESHSNSKAP